MKELIAELKNKIIEEIKNIQEKKDLENIKIKYLGEK